MIGLTKGDTWSLDIAYVAVELGCGLVLYEVEDERFSKLCF